METLSEVVAEHAELKRAMLKEALAFLVGHPVLDDHEHKADAIIKKAADELRAKIPIEFYSNPLKFRDVIESSELYKLMKKAPKGSLHHFVEYVRTHADKYRYDDKVGKFFYYKAPEAKDLLNPSADAENLTKEEFHAKYADHFVLTNAEIHEAEDIWDLFELKISNRSNIIRPKTAFIEYTKHAFEYAIEFGFQNIQGRISLHFVKDDDMKEIPVEEKFQIYLDVQREIQKTHPEFFFTAVIQSLRFWSDEKMKGYLNEAYMIKKKFPKLINGFDVASEEDVRKLSDFSGIFLDHKRIVAAEGVQNFELLLHAGESLEVENDNLYDAVLLGCPRIGHGYNLYRHPVLIEKIKSSKICIEWNPLSNQVLRYVKDLRNHPHFGVYKTGLKYSLSSDAPGVFGTDPLAWDLVSVILANKFSLQDLKGFFLNSIEYSCLDKDQHDTLRNDWFKAWHKYIDSLIE